MAELIRDSFAFYSSPADAVCGPAPLWQFSDTQGNWQLSSTSRFAGGQSLMGVFSNLTYLRTPPYGNDGAVIFGVSFRQQNSLADGTLLGLGVQGLDGLTPQWSVLFRSDGAIVVTAGGTGGTQLAVLDGAVTPATWWNLQFEVVTGASGSIKIWKQGQRGNPGDFTPDHAATGLNLSSGTGHAYTNRLAIVTGNMLFANNTIGHQFFQDFHAHNETGAAPTGLSGDLRVAQLMANRDAGVQFSPSSGSSNYAMVDEVHQDGLSTYVRSATVGAVDQYGISSLPDTPLIVDAVVAMAVMGKNDAGAREGQIELNSGGMIDDSPPVAETTTLGYHRKVYMNDPHTGAPWTPAAVNALQIGPKVAA